MGKQNKQISGFYSFSRKYPIPRLWYESAMGHIVWAVYDICIINDCRQIIICNIHIRRSFRDTSCQTVKSASCLSFRSGNFR